jgi:Icc-related predicted phosphoesterase
MIIAAISDSHGRWKRWKEFVDPEPELVIIAGDMFSSDNLGEQREEMKELMGIMKSGYPNAEFIIVPGNHDFYLQQEEYHQPGVKVLVDSELEFISLEGTTLKIWGNPWTMCGNLWAFSRSSGTKDLKKIPAGLDILVTHEAPRLYKLKCVKDSLGDYGEEEPGNLELADVVKKQKPKIHIFGHIHKPEEGVVIGDTTFYNVSSLYPMKIKIEETY